MKEGAWHYQPVADHHNLIYFHLKTFDKVLTDSFIFVNLHPPHNLSFSERYKKIVSDFGMGGKYFLEPQRVLLQFNGVHVENMTTIKPREVMFVIHSFFMENPDSKSWWMK